MREHRITEYVELDREREWKYLSRFYEAASRFYAGNAAGSPADFPQQAVSEEEIQQCIRAFKRKPAPRIRREVRLGRWRFALDEPDEGIARGFFAFSCDDSAWEAVELPHSVNHVPAKPVRYGSTPYRVLVPDAGQRWDIWVGEYGSWYRTRLAPDTLRADEVASLQFDSVNLAADVWVNEMPVMMGHVGLFPFAMEVTDAMGWAPGRETLLAVRVKGLASNTPYLFANGLQVAYGRPPYLAGAVKDTDWRDESWSGIGGEATLRITGRVRIESLFLATEGLDGASARIGCRLEVRNASWKRFRGRVRLEASPWLPEEQPTAGRVEAIVDVPPMGDGIVEVPLELPHPLPWSPEHPNLYLAYAVLADAEGRQLDDRYESFGVRTFRMAGSAFELNGRRFVPRGTHDLASYAGDSLLAPTDRSIVRDILLHKKMGATCSRWPSDIRMHYPRIAEYADQLGFAISWTGYFEMWCVHPQMELHAKRDVPAMVRSLLNRPSILAWEMGDEPLASLDDHRRFAWYDLVYRLVAAEDRSRPIIPAGSWSNDLVDIIDRRRAEGQSAEDARREALRDHPVLGLADAPWDVHCCPYLPPRPVPTHRTIDKVREDLGGERATIYTEFGLDGMPRPGNVESYYGRFTWNAPAIMPIERGKKDLCYYGRPLGPGDWRQSQAAQALLLAGIIGQLREHPEAFAGYYFPTLVDAWTFYWGVVDVRFNAKLAWYAARSCYATVYVTGLHGSVVQRRTEPLEISAGSYGDPVRGARLVVAVSDEADRAVLERSFTIPEVPGDAGIGPMAVCGLEALPPGLYGIAYRLTGADGGGLAERFELCYLVDPED